MITLQITRTGGKDPADIRVDAGARGVISSFKFVLEQEFEESGSEASPTRLEREGFKVKPEDISLITTLLEGAIKTVNA